MTIDRTITIPSPPPRGQEESRVLAQKEFRFPYRFHLLEICDQPWLKGWMREAFMDCLAFLYFTSRPYHGFSKRLLKRQDTTIFDLATGGGDAIEFFLKYLKKHDPDRALKVVGTDLFPDLDSLKILNEKYPNFSYKEEAVDAMSLPVNKEYAYTMFTAFHHFKEEDAIKLIRSTLSKGKSFTIFEFTSRYNPFDYIWLLLGVPFYALAPFFSRKWRWQKFLFSFIPIIPLIVLFDGFVSNLRTYTKDELVILAQNAFPGRSVQVDFVERRFCLVFNSYM